MLQVRYYQPTKHWHGAASAASAASAAVVVASAVVAAAALAAGAGRYHCQQTSKTEEKGRKALYFYRCTIRRIAR